MAEVHQSRSIDLSKRPDAEGLSYSGHDCSLEVLPHLGLSWATIRECSRLTGKPIGDFGASFGSLAAEGALRGTSVVPVDIRPVPEFNRYLKQVAYSLRPVHGAYVQGEYVSSDFNAGLAPSLNQTEAAQRVVEAIGEAFRRYVAADIAALPFPDRFFALSIAHDSVPKHAANLQAFATEQLPELLRVTDQQLRIVPLAHYGTDYYDRDPSSGTLRKIEGKDWDQLPALRKHFELRERHALYADPEAQNYLERVAAAHGFSLSLAHPHQAQVQRAGGGMVRGSVPELAIFTRRA